LRKIYFITADKWGWSIDKTDATEFYMLEYILEDLEEKISEENKRYKKQEDEYKKNQNYNQPKPPKVGQTDFGGFKTPKMNIPNMSPPGIKMPKF
jgi:hypothetical protein